MENMLNKLLDTMGVGTEVVAYTDGEVTDIRLPLGKIDAGIYENTLWGDAVIEDTDAVLQFRVGDIYGDDEFGIGEGVVNLNYLPESGLAYGGELEDTVSNRISDLYGIKAFGSEQGMQGDDYLSLDIVVDL